MPTDYAIKDGRTVFDATTYTGTATTQIITNAGGFKPDFVWTKARNNSTDYHCLMDSVRGTGKALFSNAVDAEQANGVSSFNSNGFTGTGWNGTNGNFNYVGWQWQAGQGTTSSNTSGSITSTVSVNATAGFSIVTYTSNGSANASSTVGHGLSAAPSMIVVKSSSVAGQSWAVYHTALGRQQVLVLNSTSNAVSFTDYWGTTGVTSTVFGVQADGYANNNGNMVAYCWAEVAGFSKFGSYTGNGSTDGPFIYTGFRPKFILYKRSTAISDWVIWDTTRNPSNVVNLYLLPNSSAAEGTFTSLDILSNGFKLRTTASGDNANGATYVYACFAENPFKYSNAR